MVLFIVVSIGVLVVVIGMIWARTAGRPDGLGVKDGRLAPCPGTPNCVSTQGGEEEQWMGPIVYTGSEEVARERLLEVLRSMDRVRVVTENANYVAVEFRSWFFGFVDDAEFYLNGEEKVIHFRSAARLGHSDFGVNRRRMERIVAAFSSRGT